MTKLIAGLMLAFGLQGCGAATDAPPAADRSEPCAQGAYIESCSPDADGARWGTKACQPDNTMSACQCSDDCDAGVIRECFAPDGSLLPRDKWPAAFTGHVDGCSFVVVDPDKCFRCE